MAAPAYGVQPAVAIQSQRPPVYNVAPNRHNHTAPPGTFATGTKIQVGSQKVVIDRYLSEGGFAHVYLVRLPQPIDGTDVAVLKRVAVPDKEALSNMRTEVETMKKLKGHRYIVRYIDSHASQLKGGGYEVFLLMEYCAGGGLIDFMNTRLQNRLTEVEVLKIISDVAEGVACMHYLKPTLLHRDLKVENVLIALTRTSTRYKLCDFGSTAPPRPAPRTVVECRLIEEDVQKHTTLQYRSPEMVDVYRKLPIDEKSDIWALGVLLYKLCYYTTPFEDQGQLAILNASFKFPNYPSFSDRIKKLIASMLKEDPDLRPNIYQVVKEICSMRGKEVPIKDIYTGRSQSEVRSNQKMPSATPVSSSALVGAFQAAPVQQQQVIPDIVPMRRGRPTSSSHQPAKQAPSSLPSKTTDPFAALDSNSSMSARLTSPDELSSRFPTLDQFTILHEPAGKFEFDPVTPIVSPISKDLSQRVTEKLADDAFARPSSSSGSALTMARTPVSTNAEKKPDLQSILAADNLRQSQALQGPVSTRSVKATQGSMASSVPAQVDKPSSSYTTGTIYRFPPAEARSSSQSRTSDDDDPSRLSGPWTGPSLYLRPDPPLTKSISLDDRGSKTPASSRPSLEGNRPTSHELNNSSHRSKSANARPRPGSTYLDSGYDLSREPDLVEQRGRSSGNQNDYTGNHGTSVPYSSEDAPDDTKFASDEQYLEALEEYERSKRRDKRSSNGSKHSKRSSMPSMSLSGTKTLLVGRFGDAFRRFETNTGGSALRTPSPSADRGRNGLSPITGSERTGGTSDDGHLDEEEEMPQEMKRELERRRLSQEERRVEAAAAEYKMKLADRDRNVAESGKSRAPTTTNPVLSIQEKVKDLLEDSSKASSTKPLEGYGHFADSGRPLQSRPMEPENSLSSRGSVLRKPLPLPKDEKPVYSTHAQRTSSLTYAKTRQLPQNMNLRQEYQEQQITRPDAPPKPRQLRTGPSDDTSRQPSATSPHTFSRPPQPSMETGPNREDWEADFSKRYPSLSGLEMVETEIGRSPRQRNG